MSTKKKIEFKETWKEGAEQYEPGDKLSFPAPTADKLIEIGVAKCCETGTDNERKPGAHRLDVHSVVTEAR